MHLDLHGTPVQPLRWLWLDFRSTLSRSNKPLGWLQSYSVPTQSYSACHGSPPPRLTGPALDELESLLGKAEAVIRGSVDPVPAGVSVCHCEGQVSQSYAESGAVSCLLIESLRATFARSRTRNQFANVSSNISACGRPWVLYARSPNPRHERSRGTSPIADRTIILEPGESCRCGFNF